MENENISQTEEDAEWGVVELMGHVIMAGRISVEGRFDGLMGRIDEGHNGKIVTRYFNRHNVYRLTLTDEATARRVTEDGYFPDRGFFTADDDPTPPRKIRRQQSSENNYFEDDGEDEDFDDSDPFANE